MRRTMTPGLLHGDIQISNISTVYALVVLSVEVIHDFQMK